HFSSTDSAAILVPDYTFTSVDGGLHRFTVTLNTASPAGIIQAVSATDPSSPSIAGSANVVMRTIGVATHLVVDGGTVVAGAPGGILVRALDANGNAASGYRGTIHFRSSDPAATLPADT